MGLLPVTGAWPPARPPIDRMLANGPLARRAEDLEPLLRILAGPDGEDELVEEVEVGDPTSVDLAGLRVVVSQEAWLRPVSGELLAARERAAGALAAAGARVESRSMRDLRRALELYLITLSAAGEITIREIVEGEGMAVGWRQIVRRGGDHSFALRLALGAERLVARMPQRRSRKVLAAGESFADEMAATIGDGVLLHPPLTGVAPKHGRTVGRPWWVLNMAVFNLSGAPVTQVPLGLGREGLPLGVQVAARHGRDHVSIAVALELERVFGGWVPPPAL
jgi:fatty acid amide hydrolase 2